MKTLKETWYSLTGKPADFTMEHRLLHVVILLGFILLLLSMVINLALGLYTLGLIIFLFCVLLAVIYYFSRVQKIY